MFLFLSYYFQTNLHYSALKSGIAFLPFSAGTIVTSGATSYALFAQSVGAGAYPGELIEFCKVKADACALSPNRRLPRPSKTG